MLTPAAFFTGIANNINLKMKIYIGTDHNGYKDKEQIIRYLKDLGHEVIDDGNEQSDPADDFPLYASKVVKDVLINPDGSRGILLCGSGQGMCMAANRYKGIRACLCRDENDAHSARYEDDANVLCLSADNTSWPYIEKILITWLNTIFSNEPRYVRRVKELDNLN